MSDAYTVDGLPFDPIPAGRAILVVGSGIGGARTVQSRLLVGPPDEAILIVAADRGVVTTVESLREVDPDLDGDRIVAIGCSGEESGTDGVRTRSVSTPTDLTGIGIQFSEGHRNLELAGYDRVRSGIASLTTLVSTATELRPIYRFLHSFTGHVRSRDGLLVCTIDDATVTDDVFHTIESSFDARIDVEADDERRVRLRGLAGQSDEWLPFE
ncbi:DUF7504 family protein [Halococcoides cellulosivorans]|uniref:Uncharacterized protein n=1 Tax=Halococcoides cellulosivorans TaxID=1679096 RepID=A0A2R4X0P7_9EURY|nr:hypothetical protein [Halococcoides cellulosivorans]AWB27341.1 hypothetical protein HARCEL1_06315 [Halococcoides cellulosivorans]